MTSYISEIARMAFQTAASKNIRIKHQASNASHNFYLSIILSLVLPTHSLVPTKLFKRYSSTMAIGDPPKEAIAIVCTVFFLGINHLPSVLSRLDEIAQTPDIIAQPLFPEIISKFTLAYIRLSVALFFASVTLYRSFMVKN